MQEQGCAARERHVHVRPGIHGRVLPGQRVPRLLQGGRVHVHRFGGTDVPVPGEHHRCPVRGTVVLPTVREQRQVHAGLVRIPDVQVSGRLLGRHVSVPDVGQRSVQVSLYGRHRARISKVWHLQVIYYILLTGGGDVAPCVRLPLFSPHVYRGPKENENIPLGFGLPIFFFFFAFRTFLQSVL